MKNSKCKLAAVALVAAFLSAGCLRPMIFMETQEFNNWDESAVSTVNIENTVGSVTVKSGDEITIVIDKVGVSAESLDRGEMNYSLVGGVLSLKTVYKKDFSFWEQRPALNYVITLPEGTALGKISTDVGGVSVSGNFPVQSVTTDVGTVTFSGADTESGIAVGSISTTSGSVDVEGPYLLGKIEADVGSVQVRGALSVSNIEVITGSIEVESEALAGDTRFRTSVGSIKVGLPAGLPIQIMHSQSLGNYTLLGTFAKGDEILNLTTETGSITLYNI